MHGAKKGALRHLEPSKLERRAMDMGKPQEFNAGHHRRLKVRIQGGSGAAPY